MITCNVSRYLHADIRETRGEAIEMARFSFSYEAANSDDATQIAAELLSGIEAFELQRNEQVRHRKNEENLRLYEETQQYLRQQAATPKES